MRRHLVVLLGLTLALATSALAAPPFERGPYAGAPTPDSVVVSWLVEPALPGVLEIAPALDSPQTESETLRIAVPAPSEDQDGQVDVLVEDLVPATAYVYRVIVQSGSEIVTSPIGRFRTAPRDGGTATFAVLADTQWQWEGPNRLAVVGDAIAFDAARRGGFDFILHAGDLVETPNAFYWPHWFASFASMLQVAPFVPVLGNHEKNSISYYKAFAHPPGGGQSDERWWTLHWGDLVVVGLDTAATRADRILEQQNYARAQLAGPERWKFVIFHHPVFSSDAYHGSGYSYDIIYHPIFVESGVDIVFNGHAHNYERIERDGVVYLVLGGGGAVPRPLAPTRVDGSVVAIEGHNFYARVSTTPDEARVDIVSVAEATETEFAPTAGELLDTFTLQARPPIPPGAVAVADSEPALSETPATAPSDEFIIFEPIGERREVLEVRRPELPAPAADEPSASLLAELERIAPVVVGIGLAVLASAVAVIAAATWIVLRILL